MWLFRFRSDKIEWFARFGAIDLMFCTISWRKRADTLEVSIPHLSTQVGQYLLHVLFVWHSFSKLMAKGRGILTNCPQTCSLSFGCWCPKKISHAPRNGVFLGTFIRFWVLNHGYLVVFDGFCWPWKSPVPWAFDVGSEVQHFKMLILRRSRPFIWWKLGKKSCNDSLFCSEFVFLEIVFIFIHLLYPGWVGECNSMVIYIFLSGGFIYFLCFPCLGKSSHLTIELSSIFQTGWNHQLAIPHTSGFCLWSVYSLLLFLGNLGWKKYQLQQFCAGIDHVQQKNVLFFLLPHWGGKQKSSR